LRVVVVVVMALLDAGALPAAAWVMARCRLSVAPHFVGPGLAREHQIIQPVVQRRIGCRSPRRSPPGSCPLADRARLKERDENVRF
jgi:hypothetical protein